METENSKIKKVPAEPESRKSEGNAKKQKQRQIGQRRKQQKPRRQQNGETVVFSDGSSETIEQENTVKKKQPVAESPASQRKPVEPPTETQEKKEYEVIGVRFKQNGKVYYFDPAGMILERDAHVIVDTARGIEYGIVSMANRFVSAEEVVLPLRKAIRSATEEDERKHERNLERETEAYNLCLSKIEEHRLDMKLVDVEYTFDNTKLLFYFTQIGIRDEAKLMGGLGVCGRPFCCASFLSDFVQVSIKMAKEQNLSLNSSKISGACGRLMCCLRYEYDAYTEEIAKTPKVDTIVDTPDGEGIVVEVSPLAGLCKVSLTKNPASVQLYHRDDLKIKGYAKGRRKGDSFVPADSADELKKLEEN